MVIQVKTAITLGGGRYTLGKGMREPSGAMAMLHFDLGDGCMSTNRKIQ